MCPPTGPQRPQRFLRAVKKIDERAIIMRDHVGPRVQTGTPASAESDSEHHVPCHVHLGGAITCCSMCGEVEF